MPSPPRRAAHIYSRPEELEAWQGVARGQTRPNAIDWKRAIDVLGAAEESEHVRGCVAAALAAFSMADHAHRDGVESADVKRVLVSVLLDRDTGDAVRLVAGNSLRSLRDDARPTLTLDEVAAWKLLIRNRSAAALASSALGALAGIGESSGEFDAEAIAAIEVDALEFVDRLVAVRVVGRYGRWSADRIQVQSELLRFTDGDQRVLREFMLANAVQHYAGTDLERRGLATHLLALCRHREVRQNLVRLADGWIR